MEQKKGFSKDFILVVIGQIISLFGNAVMRFALPLHLLSVTGSAAVLGVVSGCAFIPLAIMSPIGGIIADRVNKRNIMVVLDFITAGLSFLFLMVYGKMDLSAMTLIMLFMLYGISGAYQPSVQSSIPFIVSADRIMPANAIINMVSSLSGLLGPALGGLAYSTWGLLPVIGVCVGCFFVSAVMEIFIHIPFEKRTVKDSVLREVGMDLKDSIRFICVTKKVIGKLTVSCAAVNLILAALMIIGLPVIVLQVLKFPENNASTMYGFMQAIIAVGGLIGGIGAGVLGAKADIRKSWKILLYSAVLLIPMAVVLGIDCPVYIAYGVIAISGMVIMAFSSLYTIQIMSYIQQVTPGTIIGKVIAWVIAITTCAQPIGQVVYGIIFEQFQTVLWIVILIAAGLAAVIAVYNKQIAEKL